MELDKPRIVTFKCNGKWESPMRVEAAMRDKTILMDQPERLGGTDEGPAPLEMVLASLIGCAGITLYKLARMMDFKFTDAHFECEGDVDVRGYLGVEGICRHFCDLRGTFTIETDESEERFRQIVDEVENKCPVFNLLHDAGVPAGAIEWVRKTT